MLVRGGASLKRKRLEQQRKHTEDDKLLHKATKAIRQECKVARAFLLQKAIKKCKGAAEGGKRAAPVDAEDVKEAAEKGSDLPEDSGAQLEAGEEGAAKGSSTAAAEEFASLKAITVEYVVGRCLRELGLANTGTDGLAVLDKLASPVSRERDVERLLRHKRMVKVMKEWEMATTERRRDKLTEAERKNGGMPAKVVKRSKQFSERGGRRPAVHQANSSYYSGAGSRAGDGGAMFVSSLAGDAPDDAPMLHPKRRKIVSVGKSEAMRKAKQQQQQQQQQGQGQQGHSRGKPGAQHQQQQPQPQQGSTVNAPEKKRVPARPTPNKDRAKRAAPAEDDSTLHASWAATKARKSKEAAGVGAFKGTKVTFGDDSD